MTCSDDYKTSCGVIGGRADKSLEDCTGAVTVGGCDAFIDEECEYLGEDAGFNVPPGEITSAVKCQDFCRDFQVHALYPLICDSCCLCVASWM